MIPAKVSKRLKMTKGIKAAGCTLVLFLGERSHLMRLHFPLSVSLVSIVQILHLL